MWVIFERHIYIINRVQNFRCCYVSMFQFDRSISDLVTWQDNNTAVWTVCCVLGIAHILSSFSQQTSQCQFLRTFHFKSELSEHFLLKGLLVSHMYMYILCFFNKVLTIRSNVDQFSPDYRYQRIPMLTKPCLASSLEQSRPVMVVPPHHTRIIHF